MSNKKVIKKMAVLCGATCLSLAALFSPAASISVEAATDLGVVQPLRDKIEWRFKIENNKIYKRLYNYSTAEWVGEWIYIRDLS